MGASAFAQSLVKRPSLPSKRSPFCLLIGLFFMHPCIRALIAIAHHKQFRRSSTDAKARKCIRVKPTRFDGQLCNKRLNVILPTCHEAVHGRAAGRFARL